MGYSRSAYYKYGMRKEKAENEEFKFLDRVREVRREQPRIGTKKLQKIINEGNKEKIGRDKLNKLLKGRRMLVVKRKSGTKTTYSKHEYAVSPNRLRGEKVDRPNQVFVGDITYMRERGHFLYLFLITDLYSRKIVGYNLSKNLEHENAIEALERATKGLETSGIIFHSDRGSQYCCHAYKKKLREKDMLSSMTDENHCYQNAVAERVNGILKDEFYLDMVFKSFKEALNMVKKVVNVYNTKRPHRALGLECPAEVYAKVA